MATVSLVPAIDKNCDKSSALLTKRVNRATLLKSFGLQVSVSCVYRAYTL